MKQINSLLLNNKNMLSEDTGFIHLGYYNHNNNNMEV